MFVKQNSQLKWVVRGSTLGVNSREVSDIKIHCVGVDSVGPTSLSQTVV